MEKQKKTFLAKVLMGASMAAVLLAAVGWMGTDIWLASTQWLLIAAILACFGIYVKLES